MYIRRIKMLRPKRKIEYLRTLTLNRIIDQAIKYDMWNGIIIWGEKRLGKSALALRKLRYAWGSWQKAFQHLVFTHTEFLNLFQKYRDEYTAYIEESGIAPEALELAISRRCRGIVWDDISSFLHATTMNYMDKEVQILINNLTLIAQYISNLIITTDDIDKVPSVIFNEINFIIYAVDRGQAIVFYLKKWPKFRGAAGKSYKKIYTLFGVEWEKLPPKIELLYRKIRHEHTLSLEELASFRPIFNELDREWRDNEKTYTIPKKEVVVDRVSDLIDKLHELID